MIKIVTKMPIDKLDAYTQVACADNCVYFIERKPYFTNIVNLDMVDANLRVMVKVLADYGACFNIIYSKKRNDIKFMDELYTKYKSNEKFIKDNGLELYFHNLQPWLYQNAEYKFDYMTHKAFTTLYLKECEKHAITFQLPRNAQAENLLNNSHMFDESLQSKESESVINFALRYQIEYKPLLEHTIRKDTEKLIRLLKSEA